MKRLQIKQLDNEDEEIVDALIALGLSRPIARTLAYLQQVNEATTSELETGTNLRQPEVSIAMRELKERDWVNLRDEKKIGKGRPYMIYSLKIPFDKIVSQLENQQKKAIDEARRKIARLKELGKNKLNSFFQLYLPRNENH